MADQPQGAKLFFQRRFGGQNGLMPMPGGVNIRNPTGCGRKLILSPPEPRNGGLGGSPGSFREKRRGLVGVTQAPAESLRALFRVIRSGILHHRIKIRNGYPRLLLHLN